MRWIASSRVAIVVGPLPRTRRAESPRPIPRSMRPPLTWLSVASALAVTEGSRVAGLVTQVPRRSRSLAVAMSVSRTYASCQRTWESNSHAYSKPAASAWRVSASVRSIVWSGLSVNPNFMGATSALSYCLLSKVQDGGPPMPLAPEDSGSDEVVVGVRAPVAVERPNEIAVRDGVADLLDPPQVFRQPARSGARDEHHLGAVEAEGASSLGKVPVVADVHADLADRGFEDGIAQVPRAEVVLLPEALDVRDMRLAVLAEVGPVGIDHGRGVVVDARGLLVLLVHRHD